MVIPMWKATWEAVEDCSTIIIRPEFGAQSLSGRQVPHSESWAWSSGFLTFHLISKLHSTHIQHPYKYVAKLQI